MKLFQAKKSGLIAKERISFVLESDRLSLSPKQIDDLKKDFANLILKYVKINEKDLSVSVKREGRKTTIIAEFFLKQN
ncbi:MAG: cell division topological specificity factor MinE [Caldisericia bacterium]|jgi:cell division topological specificity factor MinE|nr:cell division topological specificity factor MinE [Caldisericia bacterium]